MPSDESEQVRDERRGDASDAGLDATREYVADEIVARTHGTPQRLGDFQLMRELGRGGMGTVYEAQDLSLGRRVALKVLRFGALGDAAAVERFQREAATVAKLHHTNIVPIFSVSSVDGVHYYAMQFIEGRTLADVLRHGPVDVRSAAQCALQAAEALAHAHRHGVIHRDVKPSNILLDGDERIWLTDFGLARAVDDPALTATDAMLGTPRYMSPEQASLKRSELDNRTDIFSLGATLYELITGRPAFDGESSHQVVQAILTTDPDPPRRLRADVPRDLDTIVMKCLAKDPAERYPSASALADDLRAFLDGRTIRARQPSLAELAIRFLRRQRRGVLLTAGSIAATLVLTLTTIFAVGLYHRWQLGFLTLTTDEPRLVAELLDESGNTVIAPTSVPTRQPLELPARGYTLRASGPGRLSQTMHVDVPRGDPRSYNLSLREQTLWQTIDVPRTFIAVRGQAHDDLLLLDDEGLRLIDGATAASRWTCKLAGGQGWLPRNGPGARWPWHLEGSLSPSGLAPLEVSPIALSAPIDLNGDGQTDYVLAARHQAWLLAVSGADGQVLWFAPRGDDVSAAAPSANSLQAGKVVSAVLYRPEKLPDANGDGVADLLAVFGNVDPLIDGENRWVDDGLPKPVRVYVDARIAVPNRWIEALSGANGETLWRYDLDPDWFKVEHYEDIPEAFRWFVGEPPKSAPEQFSFDRRHIILNGRCAYAPQPPRLAAFGDRQTLWCVASGHFVALDPRTGQPIHEPVEYWRPTDKDFLRARTGQPIPVDWSARLGAVELVDLNHDGQPELVGVEEIGARSGETHNSRAQIFVCSFTLNNAARTWQEELHAHFPRLAACLGFDETQWPRVADLNGDGRSEVLIPTRPNDASLDPGSLPYGWLEARDAATGKMLWHTKLLTLDQQVDHFLIGPDIDVDGYQDIFAATLWGSSCDLHVDALSGKDGHRLWTSLRRQPRSGKAQEQYLRRLGWWSEGRDGWPQLLVGVGPAQRAEGASSLFAFSAATGKLVDEVAQFERFELTDLDGDGRQELLRYYPKDATQFDKGGTLDAFHGSTGERWRWLGGEWRPMPDVDADGLRDLISVSDDGVLCAMSGASGDVLWNTRIEGARLGQITADEDLDGDSSPDLLLWVQGSRSHGARLHAISSKKGQVLWTASFKAMNTGPAARLTAADLNGDRKPEVILAAIMDGFWLTVLSGENGSIRWKRQLSSQRAADWLGTRGGLSLAADFWNLNGDGTRDIVVLAHPGEDDTKLTLYAMDGARGSVLWEHPTHPAPACDVAPVALTADLDANGEPEVYLLEFERTTPRLLALNAADGQTVWTWEDAGGSAIGKSGPDDFPAYPRPQILRRAGGHSWICLNLWGFSRSGDGGEIICLDMHGNLVNRIPVASRLERRAFRLWTDDLTGDGDGDLLFISGDKLRAVRPEDGTTIWESTLKLNDVVVGHPNTLSESISMNRLRIDSANDVLAVLGSPHGRPRVVVREASPPSKVYGLDGGTGALRWSCFVPSTTGAPTTANADELSLGETQWKAATTRELSSVNVLDVTSGDEPPTITYRYGETTVGWQARFVEQSEAAGRPAAIVEHVAARADPRLARPLPWRQFASTPGGWRAASGLAAGAMLYCLALILLSGAAAWWLVSRRRWGLRTLALLHLVAAVFFSASLLDGPDNELLSWLGKFGSDVKLWIALGKESGNEVSWLGKFGSGAISTFVNPGDSHLSRLGKFGSGAIALPVVLALVFIGRWTVARRWRTLLAWLVVSVILAAAIGALWLRADGSQRAEDQYYSLEGWYWIWLPAAYATAVIVAVAGVARTAWRGYGRRRRLRNG